MTLTELRKFVLIVVVNPYFWRWICQPLTVNYCKPKTAFAGRFMTFSSETLIFGDGFASRSHCTNSSKPP